MEKDEKKITKTEFIGFRIVPDVKRKIEKYAKENDFDIGELLTLSVLLHIGEKDEAGKLLIEREKAKKIKK